MKNKGRKKERFFLDRRAVLVGISQADLAGLEKAPRWAKIWSKSTKTESLQNQDMLGLCYITY